MEMLRAHRLTARYRLPANRAEAERTRLDRILREAAGNPLGQELARRGYDRSELICVRRVDSRVRLRLSAPDSSLAEEWSASLAEAIGRAVEQDAAQPAEAGENVVRYPSRARAVADLVERVLRGRFERAWAWRQLGLWPRTEPSGRRTVEEALVRALAGNGELIVPVLVATAHKGLLPELVRRMDAWSWNAICGAALAAAGAVERGSEETAGQAASEWAAAVRRRSVLLAALGRVKLSAPAAESLAALACLECEPALAARPKFRAEVLKALGEPPGHGSIPTAPAEKSGAEVADERRRRSALPEEPGAAADGARTSFESEFGGLLFLLGPIADLDLPAEMFDPTGARPLCWTLHQLALRLAPAREDDPAILAFAGLMPDRDPPSRSEPVCSDAEERRLLDWKERLIAELELRMPFWNDGKPNRAALLEFVCARRCRLLADPGWFELRFALADVSTEIRRARLDLNPGYIPWLGVTVVFVYE